MADVLSEEVQGHTSESGKEWTHGTGAADTLRSQTLWKSFRF